MNRRDEFLEKTREAFEEYEASIAVIRKMIDQGAPIGADWYAAVDRQRKALDVWASLPRLYGNFKPAKG